jgi:hypothetical protein
MKHLFIFIAVSFMMSCTVIEQNKAIDYNNSLVDVQEKVADKVNEFIDLITLVDSLNYNMVHDKRKEVLTSIDKGILEVKEIGSFGKSEDFKNKLLSVFNAYKSGIENEYTTKANFLLLPLEEQTDDQYNETEEIAYVADSLIGIAEDNFIQAQEVFSQSYNLVLEDVLDPFEDN